MYTNMAGKQTLQGIYNSDLGVPKEPSTAPQLVFYFLIETDVDDPFQSMTLEIVLPGEAPRQIPIAIQFPAASPPAGRTRQTIRATALVQFPILRAGRIEAKVKHEKGEIIVGAPWISVTKQSAPAAP
jgi:hypothetical protein